LHYHDDKGFAEEEAHRMIIDGHAHVWPDAVAEKALAGVPGLSRVGDGTLAGLEAAMAEAGVDRAVCLGVAPAGRYVQAANDFLGGLDRERFIGFGSVHPDLSPEENLESLRANGLRGVKLHPIFQGYRLDDPRVLAILEALCGEYVVVAHVGPVAGGAGEGERCTPAMIRAIVERLPGLDLIACHFGGYRVLDEADEHVIGLPVHVDTAWPPSLAEIDPGRLREIVRRHGVERVVFASDWPMASIEREIASVRALGLTEEEEEAILGGNLARLLAL
jgi:predicted TIM-barrel fold metal-dependent hydrolase